MKNKLIAFLTTGLMMTSAVAIPPVYAEEEAESDSLLDYLPDWTPKNFGDAMRLYNKYGSSPVEDNYICLVRPVPFDKKDDYEISYGGSMYYINTPACFSLGTYDIEIPEKPDPEDYGAVRAYENYCDSIGLYTHDYSFFENYANDPSRYVFQVDMFRVLKGYDLTVSMLKKSGDNYTETYKYSFENTDGTVVQTDIYSWLPDSVPEFNDYVSVHGTASVNDCFIVYCSEVNSSTGASLKMEQSGEGKVKKVRESYCTPFDIMPTLDGETSRSVILYQAAADGNVDIKWTVGREWSPEEPFEQFTGKYEIKYNGGIEGGIIIDHSPSRKGNTIFTLIDKATGKTISIGNRYAYKYMRKTDPQEPNTSLVFDISENPFTVESINAYDPDCIYSVSLDPSGGRYDHPEFEITAEYLDHIDVNCYLEWIPSGDVNGNGLFNLADMVSLQKWLLSAPDSELKFWEAADFCRDNKIDAFDLCLMKQELLERKIISYVEPENRVVYGAYCGVLEDGLGLYTGPGEEYECIAKLPKGTEFRERGYQNNNDVWMFIEYGDKCGWIKIVKEDGVTRTIYSYDLVDKPVIYLYPEEETDVHVELELTGSDLATTYPKYNNGWDVTAYPDGRLLNKADGTHHRYLFWDSVNCLTRFDFSKGFCVDGSDTESFLKEKLTYMGLTEDEMNEFIVYWLPRMEHNKYNLISFQGKAYTDSAKLDITPAPDSECRVFMAYVPLEESVDIEPQQLETFERKGFAVVEWGGCEVKQ